MRTFKVLSLLLFAALTFNACSSDDDNQDDNPSNSLEKDYFSIENAKFVEETLQGGATDLIGDLQINKTVINGGSAALYFTSSTELSSVRVGVQNVKGYYDYALPKAVTPKSAKAVSFEYEVVVLLSQTLSSKSIAFSLVAVATDGVLGKISNTDEIDVLPAGTGELQVTLSWDQLHDVDLYLFDPDGNMVYYGNRRVDTGAETHKDESPYSFLRLKLMEETDYPVEELDPHNDVDQSKLRTFAAEAGIKTNGAEFHLEYNNYLAKNAVKFGIIGLLDIDSNANCNLDGINNENITYSTLKDGLYTIAVDLYAICDYYKPYPKYMVTVIHKGQHIRLSDKHRGQFIINGAKRVRIGSFTMSGGQLTVNPAEEVAQESFGVKKLASEKEAYSIF